MTPFLQFRVWLRRGPRAERIAAGLASVVVVSLAAWAVVPSSGGEASSVEMGPGAGASAGGQADAPVGGAGAAGVSGTPAAGSATATSGPTVGRPRDQAAALTGGPDRSAEAGNRCSGLGATDQGVSPTEIFIAVPVINLVGQIGNEAVGLRGADEIAATAQAVAGGINGEGGVACRKLRIKTYKVSPIDENEQRARCLEIIADKPFAVIDYGGYLTPVTRSCFAQGKLPLQSTGIDEEELAGAFPLLYSVDTSYDSAARSWVFESAARGTFDAKNGFRKLGLLLKECNPKTNAELIQNLVKVGVRRDQMSTFTVSCAVNSPTTISQAVLQHRNDGVSHVFLAASGPDSQGYVRQADGTRWKPVYLISDFTGITSATLAAGWPDGFDGAVAITSKHTGERNSGIVRPLVDRCNQWMKKAGARPSNEESDVAPPMLCDMFRLFAAAANGAGPNLSRATLLVDGLSKVGRFETALQGDGTFDRLRKVSGGDFVRAIQWHLDCKCWKVLDQEFRPAH